MGRKEGKLWRSLRRLEWKAEGHVYTCCCFNQNGSILTVGAYILYTLWDKCEIFLLTLILRKVCYNALYINISLFMLWWSVSNSLALTFWARPYQSLCPHALWTRGSFTGEPQCYPITFSESNRSRLLGICSLCALGQTSSHKCTAWQFYLCWLFAWVGERLWNISFYLWIIDFSFLPLLAVSLHS